MPCEQRMRKKFEIVREEIEQLRKQNSGEVPFEKRGDRQRELEDLYVKTKQKLDEHAKELARLREKLKQTSSELERARLEKEIAELESELEKFHDTLEKMVDAIRDLERRTISQPAKE